MKKVGHPERGTEGGARGTEWGVVQERTRSLEKQVFGTSSSAVDGQI